MSKNRTFSVGVLLVAAATLALGGCSDGASDASGYSGASGAANPIERKILGQDEPTNAPGQTLYLEEVTIAPGAELPEHFHDGTQIASVRSGVLTYDIASGSARVVRADGSVETVSGPTEIELDPGDSLTEVRSLVHHGANEGDVPVVISVAALLKDGAGLATPVP